MRPHRLPLRFRSSFAEGQPQEQFSPRYGRALAGSAAGVALGTGIGLLLWNGAAEAEVDKDARPRWRRGTDAAAALFGAGLIAIVSGGPIGAVEGAGIENEKIDGYIVAGVGEFVLGGLGLTLASLLHESRTSRIAGIAVGATVGAAAGAVLVRSRVERGAVTYRNGTWQISPPDTRVYPGLERDGFPAVNVTLVSVRL